MSGGGAGEGEGPDALTPAAARALAVREVNERSLDSTREIMDAFGVPVGGPTPMVPLPHCWRFRFPMRGANAALVIAVARGEMAWWATKAGDMFVDAVPLLTVTFAASSGAHTSEELTRLIGAAPDGPGESDPADRGMWHLYGNRVDLGLVDEHVGAILDRAERYREGLEAAIEEGATIQLTVHWRFPIDGGARPFGWTLDTDTLARMERLGACFSVATQPARVLPANDARASS